MKEHVKRHIGILLLIILYFIIRCYFSLQTTNFSDDYSYFALRQIENIAETGKPIIFDELSFGGRTFLFMPAYFYILAAIAKFFPGVIAIKVANNLFASTIIAAVYLVGSRITKNRKIAFLVAIVAALMPIYIKETLNSISPYTILVPGTFFLLYFFSNLDNNNLKFIIPLTLVLVLISPASFLLLLGLFILIFLSYLENMPLTKLQLEYVSFFALFYIWANFIFFKPAFQEHGFSIIWKNIPEGIVIQYFANIDLVSAAASIGVLPFFFGIFIVYKYLLKSKNTGILVFISMFISTFIIFWLRMIPAELALIFLSISLVILFGQFLKDFFNILPKTKLSGSFEKIALFVVSLVFVSQILPGFISMYNSSKDVYKEDYIKGFSWLNENTPGNATIIAIPEEGHLVSYFGKRKNVIDTEFLLISDINTRFKDVGSVFMQKFKIDAIRELEKYDAEYIIFSEKTKKRYNIDEISYIDDSCFDLVYNEEILIYKWNKELCQLKTL